MYAGYGKVGLFTSVGAAQMMNKQAGQGQLQDPTCYGYPNMADVATPEAWRRSATARREAYSVHDPKTGACVMMRAAAPGALAIKDPNFQGELPTAPKLSIPRRDRFESACSLISQAQQRLAKKRGVRVDPLPSAFNALNVEVVQKSLANAARVSKDSMAAIAPIFPLAVKKGADKDKDTVTDTPSTVASVTEIASFGVTPTGSDDERSAPSLASSPTAVNVEPAESEEAAQSTSQADDSANAPEESASPASPSQGLGDFFQSKNKKKLKRQSTGASVDEAATKAAVETAQAEAEAEPSSPTSPSAEVKKAAPWKAKSTQRLREQEADAESVAESTGFDRGASFDGKVSFQSEASAQESRAAARKEIRRSATEPVAEAPFEAAMGEAGAEEARSTFHRASTVEAEGTSTAWRPKAWAPGKRSQAPLSRPDELRRQVQSLLNKICPENLSTICERISKIDVQSPEELEIVMGSIFKKALADPHYSEAYADLVASLKAVFPEFPGKDGEKPVTFKSSLLNICQAEFESLPTTLEPTDEEREQCGNDKEELDFQAKKKKDRMLANMKFIGQLFLRKQVASKVLGSVMQDLLCCDDLEKKPEEHAVECVCELLYSVGLSLEATAVGKAMAMSICGRLLELSKSSAYSKRVQFAIQELLQTRAAGWARKTFKSVARTKEAIRREQERDEVAKSRGKDVTGAVFTFAGLAPDAAN